MVWKKGESGNPEGRPVKKPITDALIYIGSQPFMGKKVAHPKKETVFQACARVMLQNIIDGNPAAFNPVVDRVEGKVVQKVGGDPDSPAIKVQDISMKEVARRIGYLLLSEAQEPEDGPNPKSGNAP